MMALETPPQVPVPSKATRQVGPLHQASHAQEQPQPVAIRVERLTKTFEARPIVRNVSFTLPTGETLALLGPNGAGKSTLLRMLAALSKPTSGSITLAGYDLDDEANVARRNIGYVGHSLSLYDELTARENLLFYARMYGLRDGAERANGLLALVGLKTRANERVRNLSRGQQQRLALARALLHDPAILLLDEPDTGLDDEAIALLETMLAERRARGQTTVLTTHNLERGLSLSDRALVLLGGRVAHDGPSAALAADDVRALYTQRRVTAQPTPDVPVGASGGRPFSPGETPETGGVRLFCRQVAAIVAKDLRIELRTRQAWMAM
ncbi:MAG: heme ABC exporter ATP-binding protein CcmA, partial [Ktedonobacterales bacterium]